MASSTARKTVQQGRGTQRARSTTPTLFTPLQAIYTRPSVVAAILRAVPPPEGMMARADFSVFGGPATGSGMEVGLTVVVFMSCSFFWWRGVPPTTCMNLKTKGGFFLGCGRGEFRNGNGSGDWGSFERWKV